MPTEIELPDKYFKVDAIRMFQQAIINVPETKEK